MTTLACAQSGYACGLAGKKPDLESEECLGGRFAYVVAWMKGNRERAAVLGPSDEDRAIKFLEAW